MQLYYERTADGKFYHASLMQPPVILDSIQPGAIESHNRLEWIASVQKKAKEKIDNLSLHLSNFTKSVTIVDADSDNEAIAKMVAMLAFPALLQLVAQMAESTIGEVAASVSRAERSVPL